MAAATAREKLVAAALDLMQEQGYGATSVDRICEKAGVSKGSFYHFFKSKEDLGLAAVEEYYEQGQQVVLNGAFLSETDPMARARGFLEHVEQVSADHWAKGCLLGNFAVGLAKSEPRIQKRIGEKFRELEAGLTVLLAPFAVPKADGGPTARELAKDFLITVEGAVVLAKARNDLQFIPAAIRRFSRYCQQVAVES